MHFGSHDKECQSIKDALKGTLLHSPSLGLIE
jgi:hypothetical protein